MSKKKKRYWLSSTQGVSYSSEYQAVLDRGTTLGYALPSGDQRVLQNQLIVDLKSAGIWTLLDVFYVFATDGDSDFATINWKSPSANQASKVNSPTFTSDLGFNGNGTTSYILTNFVPATHGVNFLQNAASAFAHVNTNSSSGSFADFGVRGIVGMGNMGRVFLNGRNGSNIHVFNVNENTTTGITRGTATVSSVGLFQVQRTASNLQRILKNGVQVGADDTAVSSGRSTNSIGVGAMIMNGGAETFSTRVVSCFGAGGSLTGLEPALYTAWNTYFTSL